MFSQNSDFTKIFNKNDPENPKKGQNLAQIVKFGPKTAKKAVNMRKFRVFEGV